MNILNKLSLKTLQIIAMVLTALGFVSSYILSKIEKVELEHTVREMVMNEIIKKGDN